MLVLQYQRTEIEMILGQRRDLLFLLLAGIFVTNAILGELIGGKLIQVAGFTMSLGVIPWPIVFLTTDLTNEYFGVRGVRRLTFITVGLIIYAFVVLFAGMQIPAVDFSPVSDEAFRTVYGPSMWIIVGSIIAFVVSQFVDVGVFWLFRAKTAGKHLWLRATGSTVFSQLIDTFLIMYIAFYLPGKLTLEQYFETSATNYTYKVAIAIAMTPIVYLGHWLIDRYLGRSESAELIGAAAENSLGTRDKTSVAKAAKNVVRATKKRK
jgi:queuosine precursor transporter